MESLRADSRLHPAWWMTILVALIALLIGLCWALFRESFNPYILVKLTSDRSGLVMETGAAVKLRGIEVGQVSQVENSDGQAQLLLHINPDQVKYIPANTEAQIRSTTIFGAKYVDLIYPRDPSAGRIAAGTVLHSRNVSTEVNTVFENLTLLLDQIDPVKLNATLTALADGLRGKGETIGRAITDANQVLLAVNPRSETVRQDWRSLQRFSDTYSAAAQDILTTLSAASTTSATITSHSAALEALLLNLTGLSNSGINLLVPSQANLVSAVNDSEPTISLLRKYSPSFTCLLQGGLWDVEQREGLSGGNGYSGILEATFVLGSDPYRFPENLPIVAAKGGPGGKPGCGSLPDAAKNYPVRALVANIGWGAGLDYRPNPGIGSPCYANFLPVTRAVPESPSIRQCLPGPAIGPVPYPGAPPYGAPLFGPDGTPLWAPPPPGAPPPPVPGVPAPPPPYGPPPLPAAAPPGPPEGQP